MMKLICVPPHYYWSIPFSDVKLHFFINFFTCMHKIYVTRGTNYTFLHVLPSTGLYHHVSTKVRSIFF